MMSETQTGSTEISIDVKSGTSQSHKTSNLEIVGKFKRTFNKLKPSVHSLVLLFQLGTRDELHHLSAFD